VNKKQAAIELLKRRKARGDLHSYIQYINPDYIASDFSREVCQSIDAFLTNMMAGKRPVLVLGAPPQHGKSDIVSRYLPSYFFGKFPDQRVAGLSYGKDLASDMNRDVQRIMMGPEYAVLFPDSSLSKKRITPGDVEYYNLYLSESYKTITLAADMTVTNNFSQNGFGSVFNGNKLFVGGDFSNTRASGGFSGTTIIELNGTDNQTISSAGGAFGTDIIINKTAGTLYLSGTIPIIKDWTWTAGTVDAGTSTLKFTDTFTDFIPGNVYYYNIEINKTTFHDLTLLGDLNVHNE
jgi:hypothetical protein